MKQIVMPKKMFAYIIPGLFLLTFIYGCCFGVAKCKLSDMTTSFRFLNAQTNQDLVYGASRIYNASSIKVYSVARNDTSYHSSGLGSFSNSDSLFFIAFLPQRFDTVYIQFTQTDIDTITLEYGNIDGGECCNDTYYVKVLRYNNIVRSKNSQNTYIIHK